MRTKATDEEIKRFEEYHKSREELKGQVPAFKYKSPTKGADTPGWKVAKTLGKAAILGALVPPYVAYQAYRSATETMPEFMDEMKQGIYDPVKALDVASWAMGGAGGGALGAGTAKTGAGVRALGSKPTDLSRVRLSRELETIRDALTTGSKDKLITRAMDDIRRDIKRMDKNMPKYAEYHVFHEKRLSEMIDSYGTKADADAMVRAADYVLDNPQLFPETPYGAPGTPSFRQESIDRARRIKMRFGSPVVLGAGTKETGAGIRALASERALNKIYSKYDKLKSEKGYSHVEIADLRDALGVTQQQMDAIIRKHPEIFQTAGGDWSLSSPHVRSGGFHWKSNPDPVYDRPDLLVRVKIAQGAPGVGEATRGLTHKQFERENEHEIHKLQDRVRDIINNPEYHKKLQDLEKQRQDMLKKKHAPHKKKPIRIRPNES